MVAAQAFIRHLTIVSHEQARGHHNRPAWSDLKVVPVGSSTNIVKGQERAATLAQESFTQERLLAFVEKQLKGTLQRTLKKLQNGGLGKLCYKLWKGTDDERVKSGADKYLQYLMRDDKKISTDNFQTLTYKWKIANHMGLQNLGDLVRSNIQQKLLKRYSTNELLKLEKVPGDILREATKDVLSAESKSMEALAKDYTTRCIEVWVKHLIARDELLSRLVRNDGASGKQK